MVKYIWLLSLIYFSCSREVCNSCIQNLKSSDFHVIISECKILIRSNEFPCNECISEIFVNIMDSRRSTELFDNGSSVYVMKIKLLEKLSNIPSGVTILSDPNIDIVQNYANWARKNGISVDSTSYYKK